MSVPQPEAVLFVEMSGFCIALTCFRDYYILYWEYIRG